ncbi:hypothetical protein PAT3040_01018 [Paenibacillus agaridevorans]|uniref:Uncharacterized protein n=1 Tax=Paenibacillus agaridevorans TaxID=171404 RepID=A0A2R5ESW2_9BACL|nr:hypothetical protein [Paenibacillus agaridevorans]GBG06491.1 hypothetical protein PAT3040_01018 [Paenibacillus agaridevorans]
MYKSYARNEIVFEDELVLLAIDDHSIPATRNLHLQMERPVKHATNPVVRRGSKGQPDAHRASLFGTVLYIDGKFRMWYNASPEIDASITLNDDFPALIAYAESSDGVNWEKPNLGLVEFNGSKANNLVEIDGGGIFCCVLYEPEADDPEQMYKMVLEKFYSRFTGWTTERERITGFFTSPDGLRWKEISDNRLICQQLEVSTLYKFNHQYYLGGHQYRPTVALPESLDCGRVMVTWRSERFDAWPEERAISFYKPMRTSKPGSSWDGEEVHMGAAVWSRGNVCIGVYGQWHTPEDGSEAQVAVDLGLVVSNDGLHFREPAPGYSFLERDQEKGWDREASAEDGDNILLVQGNAFVNVNDKTYFWYTASTAGGNLLSVHENIGLATLRRDGFGYLSLTPEAQEGSLATCLIELEQRAGLYLNVDTGIDSEIKVELVREGGLATVPGYGVADILPVIDSGIRSCVSRSNGKPLELPVGTKFAIRLHIRGPVKLYAMYIANPFKSTM